MKKGFDNAKYLQMQSQHIRERIAQFDNKLYLCLLYTSVCRGLAQLPPRHLEHRTHADADGAAAERVAEMCIRDSHTIAQNRRFVKNFAIFFIDNDDFGRVSQDALCVAMRRRLW